MKRMLGLVGFYLGSLFLLLWGGGLLIFSFTAAEFNVLAAVLISVILIGFGLFSFVETIIKQIKTYKTPSKNYLEKSDSEIEIVTGKTIKRT